MEYITISKFAERAGVTVQAVYKRLKTDLAPFVKVENGVKLVAEDALKCFVVTQQARQNAQVQELEAIIESLKQENESLKLDKLRLNEELATNNATLLSLLEKQTQQSENFQILMAQQYQLLQQTLIQLPATVEKAENEFNEVDNNLNKPKKRFSLFRRSK